ncbi:MAG TPA: hypothetical protein VGV60_15950 [Candidatus Polarisedimenticolia bacterium]|nr:hypothetical protein [Candidatus Polarisedimenticolia bacterium]
MDFLRKLFATDFMPHGHCYFWQPEIVWLHVVSDSLITLAYYSIPVALVCFLRKRKDRRSWSAGAPRRSSPARQRS